MTARQLLRDAAMWFESIARGDSMEGRRALHEARAAALRALADRIDEAQELWDRNVEEARAMKWPEAQRQAIECAAVIARLDAPLPGAPLEGKPR